MNCSPCGSGSNYTSISTNKCVEICGVVSTFITNPVFNLSSLNISTFNANFFLPSTISSFIVNPYLNVNIPSTISTYITNPSLTVNIPSTISTYITNPSLTVNIPSTISTYVTNPYINVNIPSTINVSISSFGVSSLGAVSVKGNIYDVFSRLITMTPTTMFTAHATFSPQYDIVGYTSTGAGTVSVDLSDSIVLLSANDGGGRAIRQSLEYQLYEPGKGHAAYFTWVPNYSGTFDTSVVTRCGIYDDYRDKNTPAGTTGPPPYLYQSSINGGLGVETNQPSMGHFFELSGNSWFVVERANSSNNIANVTRVAQSNWNIDTLNSAYGNNPSGVQLSANVENLYIIARQWLGVGVVNMGIYYNGSPIICHQFRNRGIKQPYTRLNKLPLRYEIEKVTGGSSNAAVSASICMSSHIQGEYTPIGTTFSLPASITTPTTRVDTALKPILLLRLQQGACRATVKIRSIDLYSTDAGVVNLLKNPTITGTINWINHPDSRSLIQYAVFANGTAAPTQTVTGGQCIYSGFVEKRTTTSGSQSVSDLIAAPAFCSDIKGNPDVFCIAIAGFNANNTVNATAQWVEIV